MTHKDTISQGEYARILNKVNTVSPNPGQKGTMNHRNRWMDTKDMHVTHCATQFQGTQTNHSRDSEDMVKYFHHVVMQKISRTNVM